MAATAANLAGTSAVGTAAMSKLHPYDAQSATKSQPGMFPTVQPKRSDQNMQGCVWLGQQRAALNTIGIPMVTDPTDAIVRITTTTACGSDLHVWANEIAGVHTGMIMGHEAVGYVESVGPNVKFFKPGDRVTISAVISCGACEFCGRKQFSLCEWTNASSDSEKVMGHRTAGLFGYGMIGAGLDGLQAEFARVPIADVNLLRLPPETQFSDEKALMLSDVACTAWHACELGEVHQGDQVVIFGAGPVGQVTALWSKYRGASRVLVIDHFDYRLNRLRDSVPGVETLNFEGIDPVLEIQKRFKDNMGPDVCIDASGFRFPTSLLHKVERATRLETDSPEVVNECIRAVKKGGRISLIADYFAYANHFALGPMMEKSLTVRGGQLFCQKYWEQLRDIMASGAPYTNAEFVLDTFVPLSHTPEVYRAMSDGRITKAAIYTKHSTRSTGSWPGQPIAPLAQLTQPAPSVAGVTATISHAAENVAEAVRSGLSRIGL